MAERITTTFYPACTVNLVLRLDEAFIADAILADPVSTLDAAENPATRPIPGARKPVALQGGGKRDAASFILNRIPLKCTVEKHSVRQAATFDVSFRFKDFPLDPRLIRAAGIEIHMGSISATDFARGQAGERRADGSLCSTLRTRDDAGRPNLSTLVLVGVVDEVEEEEGEDGATVRLSGRDQRGLLLSSPLPMSALNKLDYTQDIGGIVEELLERHPMAERINVVLNPAEWPGGRVPAALPESILPRQRRAGARRGRRRRTPPAHPPGHGANQELSYWDAIVRLCFLVGAVPFFVNNELIIRPARGIFAQLQARPDGTISTPFAPDAPRQVQGMDPITLRRLVVGNNLAKLTWKRKLGGQGRPRTVRCVSLDLSSRDRGQNRLVEARWPPEAPPVAVAQGRNPRAQTVAPSGTRSQEDVLTYPIQGIRSEERLRDIARALFEEMGRQEITATFTTKNLASFGAGNEDPDMLRANPGDAVEVVRDGNWHPNGSGTTGTMADHYNAPLAEMIRQYTDILGDETLARALAVTSRGRVNAVLRTFRLAAITLSWTKDKAIEVEGEIQNYVIVRSNVAPETPSTPTPQVRITRGR